MLPESCSCLQSYGDRQRTWTVGLCQDQTFSKVPLSSQKYFLTCDFQSHRQTAPFVVRITSQAYLPLLTSRHLQLGLSCLQLDSSNWLPFASKFVFRKVSCLFTNSSIALRTLTEQSKSSNIFIFYFKGHLKAYLETNAVESSLFHLQLQYRMFTVYTSFLTDGSDKSTISSENQTSVEIKENPSLSRLTSCMESNRSSIPIQTAQVQGSTKSRDKSLLLPNTLCRQEPALWGVPAPKHRTAPREEAHLVASADRRLTLRYKVAIHQALLAQHVGVGFTLAWTPHATEEGSFSAALRATPLSPRNTSPPLTTGPAASSRAPARGPRAAPAPHATAWTRPLAATPRPGGEERIGAALRRDPTAAHLWYWAWRNWNSSLMRSSDSGMVNLKGCPAAWCGAWCGRTGRERHSQSARTGRNATRVRPAARPIPAATPAPALSSRRLPQLSGPIPPRRSPRLGAESDRHTQSRSRPAPYSRGAGSAGTCLRTRLTPSRGAQLSCRRDILRPRPLWRGSSVGRDGRRESRGRAAL